MTPKEIKKVMDDVLAQLIGTEVVHDEKVDTYLLKFRVFDRAYSCVINEKAARNPDEVRNAWSQCSAEFFKEFSSGVKFMEFQEFKDKQIQAQDAVETPTEVQ